MKKKLEEFLIIVDNLDVQDCMTFVIITLVLIIAMLLPVAFGSTSKNKDYNVYKPVGQSNSTEIKLKKNDFNACVQSGENRAKCYRLYYGN